MRTAILGIVSVLVFMCNSSYGDVLVDQFNYVEKSPNNIVTTLSNYGEVELVSCFKLTSPATISHVEWSGLLREVDEEGDCFNVRIYRTHFNQPTKFPRRDFDIIAYGERPYPWAPSVVFFTSEDLARVS